jgi:undecaprenyl diphosphate synthase
MVAVMTPGASAVRDLHVAIIMDGNGRWATERGLPRVDGHRRGAAVVRRVVEGAATLGIGTLTLFAFSSDNWRRPRAEVATLMALFGEYLEEHASACVRAGIRVALIGRRDRLPSSVRRSAERVETATAAGRVLLLRLAIDYSARDAIARAAERAVRLGHFSREAFADAVARGDGPAPGLPDVDLVVRTGGERRLSDFLLWECAYAELWFTDVAWPDFTTEDLGRALDDFARRERRFGALPAAPATAGEPNL